MEQVANGGSGASRHGMPISQLMSTDVGELLGLPLELNLYLRNPFRVLALPASADTQHVEKATQYWRNLQKLDPAAALRPAISTGYEEYDVPGASPDVVAALRQPQRRLVSELFWPHLEEEDFSVIKKEGIDSPEHLELAVAKAANGDRRADVLGRHALAIAYHNRALSKELSPDGSESPTADWNKSLSLWKTVVASDVFWEFVRRRVDSLDDPRFGEQHVKELRTAVPELLLRFHAVFAEVYMKADASNGFFTHVKLIEKSGFPRDAKRPVLESALTAFAKSRMEELADRLETEVTSSDDRMARSRFEERYGPILNDALGVWAQLRKTLSDEEVEVPAFDAFCRLSMDAVNEKIDYSETEHWSGDILYSILVSKRLLELPVSENMRRDLRRAVRSDTDFLRKDLIPPEVEFDPTKCWFLPEEEADPDSSREVKMYKITDREVTANPVKMTYGVRVGWRTIPLIIPRSAAAAAQSKGEDGDGSEGGARWAQLGAFGATFGLGLFGIPVVLGLRYWKSRELEDGLKATPVGWWLTGGVIGSAITPALSPLMILIGLSSCVLFTKTCRGMRGAFPLIAAAQADGFKFGTKPSDLEMEMTESESQEGLRRLRGY